jgi:hypothetical protein
LQSRAERSRSPVERSYSDANETEYYDDDPFKDVLMAVQLSAVVKNGKIEALEPFTLPEGTQLLITVASDEEADVWANLALQELNRAYRDDEPEYELSQLKEINPLYEGE